MDNKTAIKIMLCEMVVRAENVKTQDEIEILTSDIAERIVKLFAIPAVINWASFTEKNPNYGDLIILRFPPEAKTYPIITVYDIDTHWYDGDVYAVIEPCL